MVYWYCDIIDTEYNKEDNTYIFHDLLIDILLRPNGSIEVVDLDELGDLLDEGKITPNICSKALKTADNLLKLMYSNQFYLLQNIIEELE